MEKKVENNDGTQRKMKKINNIPYLSNVKFILYDYDVEGVWNQFHLIDSVLRDIEHDILSEEESEEIPVVQETVKKIEKEEESENIKSLPPKKRPLLLSIPYKVSPATVTQNIRTTVGLYVQQRMDSNPVCAHCNSKEVIQQDQLAQLSNWRKAVMSKILNEPKSTTIRKKRMKLSPMPIK